MPLPLLNNSTKEFLNIIVVGAHPDDPETGVGGTILKYIELGHNVTVVYLTKGEAGIPAENLAEAGSIRENEARNACKVLNCEVMFLDQIDGDTEITSTEYARVYKKIMVLKPDLVFTHWPIDTHRDHRVCFDLIFDCWNQSKKSFCLYYFEAITGHQTQNFHPNVYVDITGQMETKKKSCDCHVSQNPMELWETHEFINKMRGQESNYRYAEAFVQHDLNE